MLLQLQRPLDRKCPFRTRMIHGVLQIGLVWQKTPRLVTYPKREVLFVVLAKVVSQRQINEE